MPLYYGTICCTFILLLFNLERQCVVASPLEEGERVMALEKLRGLKIKRPASLVNFVQYKEMAKKFATAHLGEALELLAERAINLQEPFEAIATHIESGKLQKYKEYQQLRAKPLIMEVAIVIGKLAEYHSNPIKQHLADGKEIDVLAQKSAFFTQVNTELQMLYSDFEKQYAKNESLKQVAPGSYALYVVNTHVSKIAGEVHKYLIELLDNMANIWHERWQPKRLLVWAMVEDILKPLLQIVPPNCQDHLLQQSVQTLLLVYGLFLGRKIFHINGAADLVSRQEVAKEFLAGTLHRHSEYVFTRKPASEAFNAIPLHFGEVLYDQILTFLLKGGETKKKEEIDDAHNQGTGGTSMHEKVHP